MGEKEHIEDIEKFLKVLIKNGLKLKMEKCCFGKPEIKYLGFIIGQAGIRPDPHNIATVKKFGTPKTITELRSLIGAVSYFRRFIKNFASIMYPLYELTKKEEYTIKNWDTNHQQALETITQKLSSAPVLAPPKFGKSFIIETDASKIALGAFLLQEGTDGLEHPVAFASRKLNKFESKYPSVEMEALGIVFALKEFRAYIEGSELTVVRTDNSALCSLFKRKDLTGRLAKYQLVVQEYNIKIEYRKGKTNKFCDYISRYITINAVQTENIISLAEIIKEQKQVRKVCELYDAITNNIFPSNEVKRKEIENEMENFTVINDAVHRRNPIRLFIPYVLRSRLINSIHCCPLVGGHLGIKKTLAKILPRFWWDGINFDVKKIIMGCKKCQQRKTAPGQKNFRTP